MSAFLAGCGGPLERQSSFDRLLTNLNITGGIDVNSEAEIIQAWYRRKKKMSKILSAFDHETALGRSLPLIISIIQALPHMNGVDEAQKALSTSDVRDGLNGILCAYPRDPGLKKRNGQSRSAQFISLAMVIHSFSDEILVQDESGTRDTSFEARRCRNAASLLTLSFLELLKYSVDTNAKVHAFRGMLMMYRFCVRYFLAAMDAWRKLDGERLAGNLEEPYRVAYKAVLWATNVNQSEDGAPTPESKTMLTTAEAQLNKMRVVLERTLGKAAARDRMEELEATENALMAEVLAQGVTPSSSDSVEPPSPTPKNQLHHDIASTSGGGGNKGLAMNDNGHAISQNEMRFLEKLASVAGMENERIAHELALDPGYSLPDVRADFAFPESVERHMDDALVALEEARRVAKQATPELVKKAILAMMGDTLRWSLKTSSFVQGSVLGQLKVGDVIPVDYAGKFLSAKLLEIADDATLTVEFLADGGKERDVSLKRIKTASTRPDPTVLIPTLRDFIDKISGLTPTRAEIRERLESAFDAELLAQMIASEACTPADLGPLLGAMLDSLQNLLEPSRAGIMGEWRLEMDKRWGKSDFQGIVGMLPYICEIIGMVLEEIKREMANYFLETLSPVMSRHGAAFLREKVNGRIKDAFEAVSREATARGMDESMQPRAFDLLTALLPKTAGLMLPGTHPDFPVVEGSSLDSLPFPIEGADLEEAGLVLDLPGEEEKGLRIRGALLLTRLIQVPVRLDTKEALAVVPEIYQYDQSRLASIRDDLDVIALLVTLVISMRQCLHALKARHGGNALVFSDADILELHSRLDALLRNPSLGIQDVTTEIVRYVRHCVSRAGLSSSGLGPGWEKTLEGALRAAVKAESPMLSLFSKRIFKVLLRGLGKQPTAQMLTSFSLNSPYVQRAIADVSNKADRLLTFNLSINNVIYSGFSPAGRV